MGHPKALLEIKAPPPAKKAKSKSAPLKAKGAAPEMLSITNLVATSLFWK